MIGKAAILIEQTCFPNDIWPEKCQYIQGNSLETELFILSCFYHPNSAFQHTLSLRLQNI